MAETVDRDQKKPIARRVADVIRRHESKRGLMIAFEGPEGSGKSTQRRLFKTWLESEGHEVVSSKWTSSAVFKPIVKARKRTRALSAEEFAFLQAAEFRHRLENELLPALWDGKIVLADRFLFTGLARGSTRGLELDWLLHVYSPLFWPDIVLYFAVSAETATNRVAAERAPDYYEAGQDVTEIRDPVGSYKHFMGRVIKEYEALALIFRMVTIDGEQPIYEQHRQIRHLFQEGRQKPWGEWNLEAIADWIEHARPAQEARGGE